MLGMAHQLAVCGDGEDLDECAALLHPHLAILPFPISPRNLSFLTMPSLLRASLSFCLRRVRVFPLCCPAQFSDALAEREEADGERLSIDHLAGAPNVRPVIASSISPR